MDLEARNSEKARVKLWRKYGLIAPWYLRDQQLDIYRLLLVSLNPFIECARRFGKTTAILCYVLEKLRQNPGWICRWVEPWKNQCREIVMDEVARIQANFPEELRFKYQSMDSVYNSPWGSKIYLRGVNEDRGESARGPTAHIIVADEFGTWKDPNYIVQSVLRPQLETTHGPFIFASTPPEDLGHAYYYHKEWAIAESRFIQKTFDNKDWLSEEEKQKIIQDYRGTESIAFRREQMCEEIANPELLVVPEFSAANEIPDDAPRPAYFDTYTGGDSGVDDNTALLYAYFDFEKDTVVFEDEFVCSGKTTNFIVAESIRKEEAVFGTKPCRCEIRDYSIGPKRCLTHGIQPYRRVYDADKQIRVDMSCDPERPYPVELPEKTDKQAAIRWFRRQVQDRKVLVKKRCVLLRRQLRVGQWKDVKHLDFQRSTENDLKHLDALIAAIYTVRSVVRTHNPFPANVGISVYTHHIPESVSQQGSKEEEALASLFDPFGDDSG